GTLGHDGSWKARRVWPGSLARVPIPRSLEVPVAGVRVLTFDLDDTLAVSKSRVDPRMADLLTRVLDRVDVCIISGGRFEQLDSQVLRYLDVDGAARQRLHLMPTCGTRYYRWRDGHWHEEYAENLAEPDRRRVIDVLTEGARTLGLWETHTWGE